MAEQQARGDGEAGGADPVDQPHRDDAVAAQGEEVVVDADLVDPEHRGERRDQGRLDLVRGRAPGHRLVDVTGGPRRRVLVRRVLVRPVDDVQRAVRAPAGPTAGPVRPLVRAADVQHADRYLLVGRDRGEDAQQPLAEPLGGGAVEQVVAVADTDGHAVVGAGPLEEVEGQVELGTRGPDRLGAGAHAVEGQLVDGVGRRQVHDHDLEQRVAGQQPWRVDGVDHPVERQLLVVERGEVAGADPPQQLAERRGARQVGPQHDRVEEEADEVVEGVVDPAGDRAADRDVLARAHPVQQGRDDGPQHHEQAGVVGSADGPQRGDALGVDRQLDDPAGVGRLVRARPVGRQRQLGGQAGELAAPELPRRGGGARRVRLVAEQLALPQRVVDVLNGQRRPVRRPARGPRPVGGRQVPGQRPVGALVGGDVVDQELGDVQVRGAPDDGHPHRRLALQVERVGRGVGEDVRQPRVARLRIGPAGAGHRRPLDDVERDLRVGRVEDPLDRLAAGRGEDGPQRLVPGDDVAHRRAQGGQVQRPGQPPGDRDVVCRAGALHLPEHPEALLRERQRRVHRAPRAADGRPGGAGLVHPPREPGDRRVLEDRARRDLHAERRPDRGAQPHDEQRVAAEGEEVGVGPDPPDAEDGGEPFGEQLLARVTGPAAGRRHGRGRPGQRGPVHLAVDRPGQAVQRDERLGNHVGRQDPGHLRPNGLDQARPGRQARPGGVGYQVGDELEGGRGVRPEPDRRLGDARRRLQRPFDLAELDPEPAQLDLVVGTPEERERAVGAAAREVPGAVHALPRRAVRVGDEPGRCQARAAQVAPGEPGTGQVQLAGDPVGDRAQRRVQEVGAGVPDGRGPARAVPAVGVDGVLGRPVKVVGHRPRQRAQPLPQRRRGGLAADQEHARPVALRPQEPVPDQFLEVGRGQVEHVDPGPLDVVDEGGRVPRDPLVDDVRLMPGQQPQQRLPGAVEAERGRVQDALGTPVGTGGALGLRDQVDRVRGEEVDQAPVGADDRLGHAGRPRRVDHARRAGRVGRRHGRRGPQRRGVERRGVERDDGGRDVGQQPGVRAGREDGGRRRVGQQEREPVRGHLDVDRQVARGRRQHAEDRRDHQRAGQRERHHGFRAGAQAGHHGRDPVDLAGQLREGRPALTGDQRDPVGIRGDDPGQQVRHRRPRRRRPRRRRGRRGTIGAEDGQRPPGAAGHAQGGRALLLVDDLQPADRQVGVTDDLGEQPDQPVGQPGTAARVEDVGGELDERRDLALGEPVDEGHVQVELRRPGLGVDPGHRRAEQFPVVAGEVVVAGHHLEQRVDAGHAARVDRRDDVLERQVLVVEGGEVGLAGPAQQVPEGRVAGQVGPDHQRVHEEADEPVEGGVGAPGDGHPDRDVVAGAQPVQQGRDGRVGEHRHARPGGRAQCAQPGRHRPGQHPDHPRGRPVPLGRAWPVQRQRDLLRQATQGLQPEGELPGGQAALVVGPAEQVSLPEGVVGVLDRQRLPVRRMPGQPRGVGGVQIEQERAVRPLVGRDVVQDGHQHVGVRAAQQGDAQRRLAGQVEPARRGPGDPAGHLVLGASEHLDPEVRLGRVQDPLVGLAVDDVDHRAQRLVPAEEVSDGGAQRGDVEAGAGPQRERVVVGVGAAGQRLDEPQPPLRR